MPFEFVLYGQCDLNVHFPWPPGKFPTVRDFTVFMTGVIALEVAPFPQWQVGSYPGGFLDYLSESTLVK